MNKELKTKNYFLGISLFCLACTSTIVSTQLSSISSLFAASPTARLDDWRFSPETLQLEFTLSGVTQPEHFSLRQPPRVVVDLPNTKLGNVPNKQSFSGAITSIRVSQLNADVTRIVLDLAPGNFLEANQVQLQSFSWQNQNRWVLSPVNNVAYGNSYQPIDIPGFSDNNQETPLFPQLGNIPNNQISPIFRYPVNRSIPTTINNQILPQVTVPPLNNNNNSQSFNSIFPPAMFNNKSGFVNNIKPAPKPSFPVPNLPKYQQNNLDFQVIPYGQPIP